MKIRAKTLVLGLATLSALMAYQNCGSPNDISSKDLASTSSATLPPSPTPSPTPGTPPPLGPANVALTISASTNNYNVFTAAGSPATPVNVTVTVYGGVTVGSTSTAVAAFATGAFPSGSTVHLINNGNIVGRGGDGGAGGNVSASGGDGKAGGPAISMNTPLTITNAIGHIYGGGGGGGGGSGTFGNPYDPNYGIGGGGGGGCGSGSAGMPGGKAGSTTAAGDGDSMSYSDGYTTSLRSSHLGMPGAQGGGCGAAGTAGSGYSNGYTSLFGGAGGAAGAAILKNGFNLTWDSGAANIAGAVK